MTVLATNTVTITSYRDTESITRYYILQSSTAAAPSKPTTNPPPSGWTDTEPSYTSGSTNTLYFCDLMVFSDDTFAYSAVSKSSSYEAAKEAYNKAQAALEGVEEVSDALNVSIDLIIGTQTAATGSWTGVAKFSELKDGQRIAYWLPYNGSGSATLNLTLSDGSTTGAINCYYSGNTRLTTHYPAGNVIHLTYRKDVTIGTSSTKYTGWWADANYDTNTYDRTRYAGYIKCGTTAIAAGNIIVGKDGVYQHLKSGDSFDITMPILYAYQSISASATNTYGYLVYPVTIATTQSITLTAYKPVYIKGTLSGSLFTPVSTTPLTQNVPTTDDGYHYILLGNAYSTTNMYLLPEHPIFQYFNGGFKSVEQIAVEAAKVATNYIEGTEDGLIVGNMTGDTLGRNVLIDVDSVDVRNGDTVLASFGETTTIGQANKAHIEQTFNKMSMFDKNGNEFFIIGDQRDVTGVATLEETFITDGSSSVTNRLVASIISITSVTVDGTETTDYTVETATYKVTVNNLPSSRATIVIQYTTSASVIYYDLGRRNESSTPGLYSVVEGYNNAAGSYAHAEGYNTQAVGKYSHAEGNATSADGYCSHAEGYRTAASDYAHAEGSMSIASGLYSHAEGNDTTAEEYCSHAEGNGTTASGYHSHAEGYHAQATGECSHAEGNGTTASGANSHAEGNGTTASGERSHAEGHNTTASGNNSHAEGIASTASGANSHAGGTGTVASGTNQYAIGTYNIEDTTDTYVFMVGNGASGISRSNAFTVDWDGYTDAQAGYKINGTNIFDLIYPVGSVYITSTYSSPASYLGGTWTLIDKHFMPKAWTVTTTAKAGASSVTVAATRGVDSIRLRIYVTTKVGLADTATDLCQISLSELGISDFGYAYQGMVGASDGGNALSMAQIAYDTGIVTHIDAYETSTIASGSNVIYEITNVLPMSKRLNAHCEKFYWKRTA